MNYGKESKEIVPNYAIVKDNAITISEKKHKHYYIIGIDPGTINLGVSIIKLEHSTNNILDINTYNIRVKGKVSLGNRILNISDTLYNIFLEYKPSRVAIETPFVSMRRINAAIPLARLYQQLLNSTIEASRKGNFELVQVDISPVEAKMAYGGNLRTDKDTMLKLLKGYKDVVKHLDNVDSLSEHEVDAIAVALFDIKGKR